MIKPELKFSKTKVIKDLHQQKKDSLLLMLSGLDDIDFGTKGIRKCVQGIKPGTLVTPREDLDKDYSICAGQSIL